jgi:hypothetical protein
VCSVTEDSKSKLRRGWREKTSRLEESGRDERCSIGS